MKKLYSIFLSGILISFSVSSFSQSSADYNKLSLGLKMLKTSVDKYGEQVFYSSNLGVGLNNMVHSSEEKRIHVIAKADSEFQTELDRTKLKFNSKIGDYYTFKLTLTELEELQKLNSVIYIEEVAKPARRLDKALKSTQVDLVHQGTNLIQPFTGNGVVVGVVDYSFDYGHPAFERSDGTRRIRRSWVENDNSGTPPPGFNYGSEYVTSNDFDAAGTSNPVGSHGTHVASIAAGSSYDKSLYRGVAYEADLVMVENENIADALSYISSYASSVSKPAVVNMSLGTHTGPHDGTSTLDGVIDQLAKSGYIIVGSGGNEGSTKLHIGKSFSSDTLWTIPLYHEGLTGWTETDMWGEAGKDFEVQISLYDNVNDAVVFESPFISTSSNDNGDTLLTLGQDSVAIEFGFESSSSLNQKSHAKFELYSNTEDYSLYFGVTASSGMVHMWNNGDGSGAEFTNDDGAGGTVFGFSQGDTLYTVGEIGGTANDIITVGAYTTNNSFTSLNGNTTSTGEANEDLALFSSIGPTVDGRTKPDITAPGNYVTAALNSHDQNLQIGGGREDELVDSSHVGSDVYFYGAMQGTSMAAPMVTGIIALMLEQNPNLDPDQVRTYLKNNAKTDAFTGTIPAAGSYFWGYGKIDAHSLLVDLGAGLPTSKDEISLSKEKVSIYPNPVSDLLNISASDEIQSIEVMDLTGKRLMSTQAQENEHRIELNTDSLIEGVYLVRIVTSSSEYIQRVVKH